MIAARRSYNDYRPHMTNKFDFRTLEKELFTLPVTLPSSPIATTPQLPVPQSAMALRKRMFSPDCTIRQPKLPAARYLKKAAAERATTPIKQDSVK